MISLGASAVSYRPLKKSSRGDGALVGVDGGAEAEHRGRVAGGRVAVGKAAADGAHGAHRAVADPGGQLRQRGDGALDLGRGCHRGVRGHRADAHGVAVDADALELADLRQVDEVARGRQAQLHRREQRLAAAQQLAVRRTRDQLRRVGNGSRAMKVEVVHL